MGNGMKRAKLEDSNNNAEKQISSTELTNKLKDKIHDFPVNNQIGNSNLDAYQRNGKPVHCENNLYSQVLEYSFRNKIDKDNVSELFQHRTYPLSLKYKKYDDPIINKAKSQLNCVSLTMLKKEIGLKSQSMLFRKNNTSLLWLKSNLNKLELKSEFETSASKFKKKFKSPRHLEDGSLEFVQSNE